MLINYLKAALNSWYRRKFFTLLNLNIMAFSIVVITCLVSYWALLNSSLPPETRKNNMRTLWLSIQNKEDDRILGEWGLNIKTNNRVFSYDFSLLGVEKYTVFNRLVEHLGVNQNFNEINYSKLSTDEGFFDIYNFNFIAGKSYKEMQILPMKKPVVITRKVAEKLFGSVQCIGKVFDEYIISGVVDPPSGPWSLFYLTDIFQLEDVGQNGSFAYVTFLVESEQEKNLLPHKLDVLAGEFTKSDPDFKYYLHSLNYLSTYAKYKNLENFLNPIISIPLVIIAFLLPFTCMITIFRSMINEKVKELGIRKSFGATRRHIYIQIIIEGLMVSIVAGLMALIYSIPFWKLLLSIDIIDLARNIIHWRVFSYVMLALSFIGVLTGYFSSIKLARGNIVEHLSLNYK